MKGKEKPKLTVVTSGFAEKYHSENPQSQENELKYKQADIELAEALENLKNVKPRPDDSA